MTINQPNGWFRIQIMIIWSMFHHFLAHPKCSILSHLYPEVNIKKTKTHPPLGLRFQAAGSRRQRPCRCTPIPLHHHPKKLLVEMTRKPPPGSPTKKVCRINNVFTDFFKVILKEWLIHDNDDQNNENRMQLWITRKYRFHVLYIQDRCISKNLVCVCLCAMILWYTLMNIYTQIAGRRLWNDFNEVLSKFQCALFTPKMVRIYGIFTYMYHPCKATGDSVYQLVGLPELVG